MAKIELSGKPICITGASSGIGRATAIACARAGMPVVVNARRAERLESVREEIERLGGRAVVSVGDVTDRAVNEAMVAACVEAFGGVYSVFANAGYGIARTAAQTSESELRALFETNFFATMHTVNAALPAMVAAGSGHVLICSSSIGKISLPGCGAYCATKAAQGHVGRAMNLELRSKGVRVSTVHPVGTRTEFFEMARSRAGAGRTTLDEHAPRWMMQTPETVARSILRCLRRPQPEVWPSWAVLVRLGIAVTVAFPALADLHTKRLAR